MKALVTGASGFIGSAVARALIRHGFTVRVLARPQCEWYNLDALPDAEIVEGDLEDPESLIRAVAGCEALFHVAADYRLWTRDPAAMYRVNVAGTMTLMRAAIDANVQRIVYTSSVATIGLRDDDRPADESARTRLSDMTGNYKRSKYLAEQRVMEIVEHEGAPIVVVNPSAPVGPGDVKPTPTGQTIHDIAHGRMPMYVDTGLNIVHVDDVAEGHVLAFNNGVPGRRYILGGENMTLKAIIDEVCQITGRQPPNLRLPHGVLLPIAHLSELWAKVSGKPPRAPLEGVRLAKKKMFFSSSRARQELGYRSRPAREAIAASVNWFVTSSLFTKRGN